MKRQQRRKLSKRLSRKQKRKSRATRKSGGTRKNVRRYTRRQRGGELPVPNGAVMGLTMRSDKLDDPDAIPILVRKEEFEVEEED